MRLLPMSMATGYKDVLVRGIKAGVLVDGLSYRGFAWLRKRYGTGKTVFLAVGRRELGDIVSKMATDGLSVDLRGKE